MIPSTTEIWQAFSEELRRFILSRVNNPDDADDILQETFIKIHTHLIDLKDTERMVPWLYRITRNTIIDYYRTRRPQEALPESLPIEPEPVEAEPEARIAAGLTVMMECLPEKYRQALLLTEIQGLKQVELAEQAGISLSGAKSRVQRGRAMLRDALLACCHFEFDLRGHVMDYVSRPDCCQSCRS